MRLYTKLKPLLSGATATANNKGLLVCNTSTVLTIRPFIVNIVNTDGTITGITLGVNAALQGAANQITPNYSMIPFEISSWSNNSGVTLSGFELF